MRTAKIKTIAMSDDLLQEELFKITPLQRATYQLSDSIAEGRLHPTLRFTSLRLYGVTEVPCL